ncbi:O-antigen ligase family protein, partial [Planctomycetota bacterium]
MRNETLPAHTSPAGFLYPTLSYLILSLLITAICIRPLINGNTAGIGINLFISFLVIDAFLLWLLCGLLTHEITVKRLGALEIWLSLWGGLIICSPLLASYKFASFEISSIWLSDLLLFYLIIQLSAHQNSSAKNSLLAKDNTRLPYLFLLVLISTGIIVSLYSLYQYLWGLEELRLAISQNPKLLTNIPLELMQEFKARLNTNEPFGTFVYQNSLAAFLILLLPIMLSLCQSQMSILKQEQDASNRTNRLFGLLINVVFLVLLVFILLKTGARGAWLACICSLVVYLMLSVRYQIIKPQHLIKQPAFLLLVLLIVGIAITQSLPQVIKSASSSLEVRLGYWRGTMSVIKNHFWTGIGLNNLADHYLIYKDVSAAETTKTHNDFLQIMAELGILGLISFLGIWFMTLKQGLFKSPHTANTVSLPGPGNRFYLLIPALLGGALAFLLSNMFQAPLRITEEFFCILLVIVFFIWLGWILVNLKVIQSHILRLGLISGLVAVLIHSFGDFNFYVPGVSQSIWLAAACLVIMTDFKNQSTNLRFSSWRIHSGFTKGILIIILLIFIMTLGFWLIPNLIKYDALITQGKNDLAQTDTFMEGINKLTRATQINPYGVVPYYELTNAYHGGKEPCLAPLERAIELSPMSSGLYFTKGLLLLDHREWKKLQLQKINDLVQAEILKQDIKNDTLKTLAAFQKSYELYPTKPENAYRLGQVYELLDQPEQTAYWYKRALKLNQATLTPRLKLTEQ